MSTLLLPSLWSTTFYKWNDCKVLLSLNLNSYSMFSGFYELREQFVGKMDFRIHFFIWGEYWFKKLKFNELLIFVNECKAEPISQ